MRTTFAFTSLLATYSAVLATSQPADSGHNSTGGKDTVVIWGQNKDFDFQAQLKKLGLSTDDVIHHYENVGGAALKSISEHCTNAFNAMDEVTHVEEVVEVKSYAAITTDGSSPWGLQRISDSNGVTGDAKQPTFTYAFENQALGAGVDIYIVDTGVRTTHAVFTGRATSGFGINGTTADGDGHGTHTAGTAGGARFGVAQGANIIAVKVLGDTGSGGSGDVIAGMDWVLGQHNKRKTQPGFVGSVMSMSWGLGTKISSVDNVVAQASAAGIHISVAAGNGATDACSQSPSDMGGSNSPVVSVGSINIGNTISSFSNTGTCVDIYGPGENVLSAWNTGDTILNVLSGTSMACPHATGIMAYLIAENPAQYGQNPAALKSALLSLARKNSIGGNTNGGPSLLLSNGVNSGIKRLMRNWVVPDRSFDSGSKRTVTGSPASWAKDIVRKLDQRWQVFSTDSPLRF